LEQLRLFGEPRQGRPVGQLLLLLCEALSDRLVAALETALQGPLCSRDRQSLEALAPGHLGVRRCSCCCGLAGKREIDSGRVVKRQGAYGRLGGTTFRVAAFAGEKAEDLLVLA